MPTLNTIHFEQRGSKNPLTRSNNVNRGLIVDRRDPDSSFRSETTTGLRQRTQHGTGMELNQIHDRPDLMKQKPYQEACEHEKTEFCDLRWCP